jgi:molybdate transport system substrate-binding protein
MTSGCKFGFIIVIPLLALTASCAKQPPSAPTIDHSVSPSNPKIAPLVASVAASTTEVIKELNQQFQKDAGIEVTINAGPSNALAAQILAGAPADVFLSASTEWADKLEKEGHSSAKVELLTNRLVAVVPKGNPAGVHEPKDLAAASVKKIALAGENVPAGKYADQALTKLGLLEPLSGTKKIVRGEDVRATLSFVERDEAEAGVVYATDARAVPGVEVAFEFDPKLHEKIVYVLVLLKNEPANPAARRYYDFLRSPQASAAFEQSGFTSPASPEGAAKSR